MDIIAETPRFIIRFSEPHEQDTYLSLYEDERVMQYLPKWTRDDHIRIFNESLARPLPGSITGRWGIFNKADGDFIGMCLLRPFDDGSDSIELGYAIRHDYWGKGITGEMAQTLLDTMLAIQPAAKFVAVTEFGNIPSQRVLEKVGMKRSGNYVRKGIELAFFVK